MATVGKDKTIVVDFEHPLVVAALEGKLEEVASTYTVGGGRHTVAA
jgi:hypothetical protein